MLLERQVAYKIMKSCLTFVVHFFGVQLMLQKDIAKIPDAHIMKRWTKDARDVLPGPLKTYQKDQAAGQSTTFRHRLMQLQSAKNLAKGNMDIELFEIVMKHMKAAEIEADKVIAARLKDDGVVQDDDSSDEEVEFNTDKGKDWWCCSIRW